MVFLLKWLKMMPNSRSKIFMITALIPLLLTGFGWGRLLEARELENCYFHDLNLPSNAAAGVGAANVGYPLAADEKSPRPLHSLTTQVEVVVNSPERPAVLYLNSAYV